MRESTLTPSQWMHLVRLAAGLLESVDGDPIAAMQGALTKHFDLIRALHEREIISDLGPGNAILYVPESGGVAIRLERHPAAPETEEIEYPEVDLFGFEVYEPPSTHSQVAPVDVGVFDEGWD